VLATLLLAAHVPVAARAQIEHPPQQAEWEASYEEAMQQLQAAFDELDNEEQEMLLHDVLAVSYGPLATQTVGEVLEDDTLFVEHDSNDPTTAAALSDSFSTLRSATRVRRTDMLTEQVAVLDLLFLETPADERCEFVQCDAHNLYVHCRTAHNAEELQKRMQVMEATAVAGGNVPAASCYDKYESATITNTRQMGPGSYVRKMTDAPFLASGGDILVIPSVDTDRFLVTEFEVDDTYNSTRIQQMMSHKPPRILHYETNADGSQRIIGMEDSDSLQQDIAPNMRVFQVMNPGWIQVHEAFLGEYNADGLESDGRNLRFIKTFFNKLANVINAALEVIGGIVNIVNQAEKFIMELGQKIANVLCTIINKLLMVITEAVLPAADQESLEMCLCELTEAAANLFTAALSAQLPLWNTVSSIKNGLKGVGAFADESQPMSQGVTLDGVTVKLDPTDKNAKVKVESFAIATLQFKMVAKKAQFYGQVTGEVEGMWEMQPFEKALISTANNPDLSTFGFPIYGPIHVIVEQEAEAKLVVMCSGEGKAKFDIQWSFQEKNMMWTVDSDEETASYVTPGSDNAKWQLGTPKQKKFLGFPVGKKWEPVEITSEAEGEFEFDLEAKLSYSHTIKVGVGLNLGKGANSVGFFPSVSAPFSINMDLGAKAEGDLEFVANGADIEACGTITPTVLLAGEWAFEKAELSLGNIPCLGDLSLKFPTGLEAFNKPFNKPFALAPFTYNSDEDFCAGNATLPCEEGPGKECYDEGLMQGMQDCEPMTTGAIVSDPHVSGLRQQGFDFTGVPGAVYALLSDESLAINARFGVAYTSGLDVDSDTLLVSLMQPKGTWLTEVAIVLGSHRVRVNIEPSPLEQLCPQKLSERLATCLYGGSVCIDEEDHLRLGEVAVGDGILTTLSNHRSFGRVTVKATKQWRLEARIDYVPAPAAWKLQDDEAAEMAHLNLKLQRVALSSKAHGVIGQTSRLKVDAEGRPVTTAQDKDGKGIIDGVATDYQLDDICSTDFKFSAFDGALRGVQHEDDSEAFVEYQLMAAAKKFNS